MSQPDKEILVAIATYNRLSFTQETIESFLRVADFPYQFHVVDNASSDSTPDWLMSLDREKYHIKDITLLSQNVGTARAINYAWSRRGENTIAVMKMDNDVVIRQSFLATGVRILAGNPWLALLALKRKDLEERPDHPNLWYRSHMFYTRDGDQLEVCHHCMGTVWLLPVRTLDYIGYLHQPGIYGFDDALYCLRINLFGQKCAFLRGVDIDHIDPGGTPYTGWKQEYALVNMPVYEDIASKLKTGKWPLMHRYDDTEIESLVIQ